MPSEIRRRESKREVQEIDLVPASRAELSEFVEQQIVEYADEKRRAGHWTAEEALLRSRETILSLLGENPAGRGHRILKGVDAEGTRIGWIWIGPPPDVLRRERTKWLYQISVDAKARGRGFGRGMLTALHKLLLAEGIETLHLNVFKWNVVARNLYDSLGYEVALETETETGMRKTL